MAPSPAVSYARRMRWQQFDRVTDGFQFPFDLDADGRCAPELLSHIAYLVDADDKSTCWVHMRLRDAVTGRIVVQARRGDRLSYNGRLREAREKLVFTTDSADAPHHLALRPEYDAGDVVTFVLHLAPASNAAQ